MAGPLNRPIIYNTEQRDFDMSHATTRIARGNLVIFYAKCDKANQGWRTSQDIFLSAAETQRYTNYKSEKAAQQFLQGRGMIRAMLASYLGVPAVDVGLSCQEHVKPVAQCRTSSRPPPKFNLSHSGDWVVLAADRHTALGIDIECTPQCNIDAIAGLRDLFTQNERAYLEEHTAPDQKARLFLQLWRGKEAVMKATGKGFELAPNSFELLTSEGKFKNTILAEARTWNLMEITLCPGLDCAIAQQILDPSIKCNL